MQSDQSTPCPPEAPPAGARPPLHPLGQSGRPVRILAFAGGGFDTAMQLGVVHALLVTRRAPPDMVIGCSAGAVNAVAVAEVFQAGDRSGQDEHAPAAKRAAAGPPSAEELLARERARVARFRQIYEGYLQAPGRIAGALRPDTFQVDTQRPLAPIELPIHQQAERDDRMDALQSRAGLINLYNTLLTLRITMGTATRAIRRWLGIKAAGGVAGWRKLATYTVEGFRSWTLAGQNLLPLASVMWVLVHAVLAPVPVRERGATAGDLIFRWRGLHRVTAWLLTALTAYLLLTLWTLLSLVVIGGALVVGLAAVRPLLAALSPVTEMFGPVALREWAASAALAFAAAAAAGAGLSRAGWMRRFSKSVVALVLFLGMTLSWSGVLLAAALVPWSLLDVRFASAVLIATVPALAGIGIVLTLLLFREEKHLGKALLARYGIAKSVLASHPVREFLVDLFDPHYYDPRPMPPVVEEALATEPSPGGTRRPSGEPAVERTHPKKLLETYATPDHSPPIHVAVTVADVSDGRFSVLPGVWTVVDGLMAALAAPPILPPPPSADGVLVDGTIVANEPTRPLFSYLRRAVQPDGTRLLNLDASELHIHTVVGLPFTASALGPKNLERPDALYTSLVDIVRRALELRRFRDATLERRLTELNTRAMAGTRVLQSPPTGDLPEDLAPEARSLKELYRARVFAIEPERPLDVNRQLLETERDDDRRRVVAETVADGCRAALETLMAGTIRRTVESVGKDHRPDSMHCAEAARLLRLPFITGSAGSAEEPGNLEGPGLAEVCRYCRLADRSAGRRGLERHLRVRPAHDDEPPQWPREHGAEKPAPDRVTVAAAEPHAPAEKPGRREPWPRDHDGRPTVSLLFSGGVFRGVFQMGVLNALSELNIRPDVIAGASVGSITAAMVARTFIEPDLQRGRAGDPLHHRQRRIQWLAATYLGVDRLILTDRFADFVRALTVRAAGAQVSIRDFDRVLRRFDEANPWAFSRELRRVVAGVERLTYVSPYELNALIEAFRRQKHRRTMLLLRTYAQEWLDRMGVRSEVLGAEPLARLIRDHVLVDLPPGPAGDVTLDAFLPYGICFLATATNITQGRLEILGEHQLDPRAPRQRLLESLLASSAFPGVFRPRWSWEVEPTTSEHAQYIDGGVMDNLPLDAVAQFLNEAAKAGTITPRPDVPHLVFCASLEPSPPVLAGGVALEGVRSYWPGLLKRAGQVGYNQKIDVYRRTQRNIRAVFAHRAARRVNPPGSGTKAASMLSLEVVPVIPNWLCGTFAFHPMLGFRRSDQAASIAHGCASTLLRLAQVAATRPKARAAWGIGLDAEEATAMAGAAETFARIGDGRGGTCWFRPRRLCPFSLDGQRAATDAISADMAKALTEIHQACGRAATHRPR